MKLFTPKMGEVPRRKGKPKASPLDRVDSFMSLKATIANGVMKPQETYGIYVSEEDGKKFGLKFPARTIADSLRRFIRDHGLERDYHVVKYETRTPGEWFVSVTYEPPIDLPAPGRDRFSNFGRKGDRVS